MKFDTERALGLLYKSREYVNAKEKWNGYAADTHPFARELAGFLVGHSAPPKCPHDTLSSAAKGGTK